MLRIEDLPQLRTGDQVFIRTEIKGPMGRWLVALAIRVFTHTQKDERPTVVNHVATVVRPLYGRIRFKKGAAIGPSEALPAVERVVTDYMIAEALGEGGFQYRPLLQVYGDPELYSIAIARHREVGKQERALMLAAMGRLLGKSYGYLKVAAHVGDYGLTRAWNALGGKGDVYLLRWLCRMPHYPMCSWSSLYIYKKAERPFDVPLEIGSPDDLCDECQRKTPATWQWLFISPKIMDLLLPTLPDGMKRLAAYEETERQMTRVEAAFDAVATPEMRAKRDALLRSWEDE
jgi:hypothetical protein